MRCDPARTRQHTPLKPLAMSMNPSVPFYGPVVDHLTIYE